MNSLLFLMNMCSVCSTTVQPRQSPTNPMIPECFESPGEQESEEPSTASDGRTARDGARRPAVRPPVDVDRPFPGHVGRHGPGAGPACARGSAPRVLGGGLAPSSVPMESASTVARPYRRLPRVPLLGVFGDSQSAEPEVPGSPPPVRLHTS